jgi:hypothetical protein
MEPTSEVSSCQAMKLGRDWVGVVIDYLLINLRSMVSLGFDLG